MTLKGKTLFITGASRGTYLCTQACLPELKKAATAGRNPHVLNLSPPLAMKQHWFAPHTAYTMAKYGMSMCTLGHAGEFGKYGIAVNSLWPRTASPPPRCGSRLAGAAFATGATPIYVPVITLSPSSRAKSRSCVTSATHPADIAVAA